MDWFRNDAINLKMEEVSEQLQEIILDAFVTVLDRLQEQCNAQKKQHKEKEEDQPF